MKSLTKMNKILTRKIIKMKLLSMNQMKEIIQTSKKKIMRKKKGKKENKIRQMIKTTKQNIFLFMSVQEKFWKLNQ